MERKERVIIAAIVAAVLLVCIGMMAVQVVPANTVGIRYNNFSGTANEVLKEGVYLKIPFVEKVYPIDTKVQERTDEGVVVQTKDAQFVTTVVNVKYRVDAENASRIFRNYGTLESLNTNIIGNYAQNALNSVFSQYNVIEVLGEKRNEVLDKAREVLAKRYEEEGITLVELTMKDMDAGEAIEKAISDEAVAKKAAETARQKQETAKAEAETKRIEAQGEADANRILSESLTDELIRMKEAEARMKHGWVTVQGVDGVITDTK